jgi:hypothetical protein
MTQELLGRVHRELLDVLKSINQDEIHDDGHDFHKLLKDVEKALAQPEQEPVAWMWDVDNGGGYTTRDVGLYQTGIPFAKHTPLYSHPPQRTWVGLTDREMMDAIHMDDSPMEMGRKIEAKLKDKNQ